MVKEREISHSTAMVMSKINIISFSMRRAHIYTQTHVPSKTWTCPGWLFYACLGPKNVLDVHNLDGNCHTSVH